MDYFESENAMERYLRQKCADAGMPFSGGIELIPDCNLDCRFCYVHQNKKNRREKGEILPAERWISIIDQAYEMGVYSLLVTGGEPLLHPEFRKIYAYAAEKGLVLVLNSNGTLMNEDWIDFFKKYGCRRFNISLYGVNNETYEKLCGCKDGYDRVIHTLRLLKENGMEVRMTSSVTPQNAGQIDQMQAIADEIGFPMQFDCYMFPGTRRGIDAENQYRLSPEEAAAYTVKCFHLKHPEADYEASCRYSLSKMTDPVKLNNNRKGFSCYAGKSDFWITWNGEICPCGTLCDPAMSVSLLEMSFAEGWKKMTKAAAESNCLCEDCRSCQMRDLCQSCPSACYSETGTMEGKPEYLCKMTQEMVNIFKRVVDEASFAMPLVSVIIPVYNAETYLKRCVESFLVQTMQAIEVILVDDGSTDRSPEICDQFAANDCRVHVIHQSNKGVSAARNEGIRNASTDYIIFCDSDDFVEKDFCRSLYHKILKCQDSMVMTNVWVGNEQWNRKLTLQIDTPDPDHIRMEEAKNMVPFAYVWDKIYRKDILLEHQVYFDESINYNEDLEFNLAYASFCEDAAFIQTPLYIHLTHGGGLAEKGLAAMGKDFDSPEFTREGLNIYRVSR